MLFSRKSAELPTKVQALPGRSEPIATATHHFVNGAPLHGPFPARAQEAMFGLGCFWGAERKFWSLPGVLVTAVGYAGGHTQNATYKEVCSGMTGHNEVVRVVFDPAKLNVRLKPEFAAVSVVFALLNADVSDAAAKTLRLPVSAGAAVVVGAAVVAGAAAEVVGGALDFDDDEHATSATGNVAATARRRNRRAVIQPLTGWKSRRRRWWTSQRSPPEIRVPAPARRPLPG